MWVIDLSSETEKGSCLSCDRAAAFAGWDGYTCFCEGHFILMLRAYARARHSLLWGEGDLEATYRALCREVEVEELFSVLDGRGK